MNGAAIQDRDGGAGQLAGSAVGTGELTAEEAAPLCAAELVRLVRLVSAWKHRAKHEPGSADRILLARLVNEGPARATDLAADVLLDLSTVSRQVRSLVDRGLVERRPDPDDRRGVLLSATTAGCAAYRHYRRQRDAEIAELLQDWPPEDRRHLVRLLRRLNDDLVTHHGARPSPEGGPGMPAEQKDASQ